MIFRHTVRPQLRAAGFSLFELLITIAVIGIVSAIAVPAYRTYIATANMTKVTANFEESVRLARNTFAKDVTREAIGLVTTAPTDTAGWIAIFDKTGTEAPGGGPAYIPSTNNKTSGRGDSDLGAVGVQWLPATAAKTTKKGKYKAAKPGRLRIWRPRYLSLREQRAEVTSSDITVINQRKPD